METIKDTLKTVFEKLEQKKKEGVAEDPQDWLKKSLTKRELRHIKVKYFKNGVLTTTVDSSAWVYYFNIKKSGLLKRIREQSEQVKDVRFYLGDIT